LFARPFVCDAAVEDPALTARERLSIHAMAVFNESTKQQAAKRV
jgi:hypothetical protein